MVTQSASRQSPVGSRQSAPPIDREIGDLCLRKRGHIQTLVDRFTLWCYHPTDSGKYVVSPMGGMRVGAGLSAVALMGFVGMGAGRDYLKRRRGTGQGAGTSVNEVAYSSALGQPR